MDKQVNRVKIRLMGKDYTVRSVHLPEKITEMATELDQRIETFKDRFPRLSNTDLALLTALSLVEEVAKLKEEKKELWELLGEATGKD